MISHDDNTGGHLPRGPHQLSAEQVAADQRERLLSAMVEFVLSKGYLATSVADLIRRAGISRRTFYELFPNREALLSASFRACAESAIEADSSLIEVPGSSALQLDALTHHLSRRAREHPGAIVLCAVEIAAAGSSAFGLREAFIDDYGALIQACLGRDGERPIPRRLARTLAGAAHRQLNAALRTGRARDLGDLGSQLACWLRSYRPLPAELDMDAGPGDRVPLLDSDGLLGGRAPGTLTLAPESALQRAGRRSPSSRAHLNRERILDAVAELNAKRGYSALTVETIAAQADLSERTFRSSFENKDEAFATALEVGHAKGQAIVARTRAGRAPWRVSVRNAIGALLEFLASEPQFMRLAVIDAPLASPAMARRSNEHAAAYAVLVFDGSPRGRNPPPIAPETIMHGLFELAYSRASTGEAAELPRAGVEATYLALAPFLGAAEAAEAAS